MRPSIASLMKELQDAGAPMEAILIAVKAVEAAYGDVPKDLFPMAPKTKRGSRLAPEWELQQEEGDWALQQGLSADETMAEAEKFKDYWTAKVGKDAVKLDWTATWRNWVRKKLEDGKYGKVHKYS